MNGKKFLIVFGTFVVSTSLLLWIGQRFDITWLIFQQEKINQAGDLIERTGSVVPFVIGVFISFIVDKLYDQNSKQKTYE